IHCRKRCRPARRRTTAPGLRDARALRVRLVDPPRTDRTTSRVAPSGRRCRVPRWMQRPALGEGPHAGSHRVPIPRSKAMHRILLFLLLCVASIPCRADTLEESGAHVLFVGNSLTYVANTPAVYSALAAANGHPTRSDMIVRGGATLAERVADGSVERALAQ